MAPDVAVLRIRLLGELSLQSTAGELPLLESGRAISLLACLLVHREAPQSRQRLAFLLWPDSTEPQALTNLRHLLHTLRRALPDSDRFLHVTQRAVGWRADAPYWLDVAAFEDALRREALEEAVELYRGDLLEGLDEPWLRAERARLQRLYLGALERLAPILEARGDHAEAILCAERLLRHDPLQEEAYRLLMRMHDARGDRARAVRVYHVCAAVLEHELGVEPSQPTRDAYEALLQAAPEPVSAGGQPFVGRTREHERAAATWRRSAAGRAQLLLVTGEAGVGKTRLVEELRSACARGGAATAEARSYAAEGALAYGPVVAWLRSPAFAGASERVEGGRSELARLLPELGDPPAAPERHSEHERRVRLFDTVARVLLSPGAPVLLVADDLQWWDPDSLQLLHYVLRAEPDARLLVAATARAEDVAANPALHDVAASLRAAGRCEELALERMSRADTAQLAERVAERPLSELEQDALYGETEGNPLFVVEAVRAGWPQAAGGEPWPTPRVQTVIESRLAQLSEPARDLVGVAATIGREFTTDVLAAASGADSTTLVPALDELWRRRVIQERVPDGYDFTHDKLREVALAALSPAARRSHHLRVARALERLQPAGTVAGQLAAHLDAAGAVDEAISRYLVAADAAHERYAHADAVSLLGRAIELGRRLPPTPQHRKRDLAILTALPDPLGAVEGYASPGSATCSGRRWSWRRRWGSSPRRRCCDLWRSRACPAASSRRRSGSGTGFVRTPSGTATACSSPRAPTCWASPRSGRRSSRLRASTSRPPSSATRPSTAPRTRPATRWIPRSSASAAWRTRGGSWDVPTRPCGPATPRSRSPTRSGIPRAGVRRSCSRPSWRSTCTSRSASAPTRRRSGRTFSTRCGRATRRPPPSAGSSTCSTGRRQPASSASAASWRARAPPTTRRGWGRRSRGCSWRRA